jgi:hypothetical protein
MMGCWLKQWLIGFADVKSRYAWVFRCGLFLKVGRLQGTVTRACLLPRYNETIGCISSFDFYL